MKAKLDKDALKKHHYWVVAGAALLLSLAALFLLRTGVRASINTQKKKVETSLEELIREAGKEVKSKGAIEVKRKEADRFKAREILVWQDAFEKQADLIRFPPEIEAKYKFNRAPDNKDDIGLFLTSIAIHDAAAVLDPLPLLGNTFKGKVVDGNEYSIRVKGTVKIIEPGKSKDEEPKETIQDRELTFYNTPGVKVTIEGGAAVGKGVFQDAGKDQIVTVNFERGRYFNDLLTQQERTDFKDSYLDQFEAIVAQVDPIDIKGKGVVQLGGGGSGFVPFEPGKVPLKSRYLHILDKTELNPVQDFSELAWIAQENVWIQREIYRLIDQANSYVRKFELKSEKKDPDWDWMGENAYWETSLKMEDQNNIKIKLRNLLPRRQGLGVVLLIWFKDAKEPERVPVSGASARDAAGGTKDSHTDIVKLPDGVERGGIERVEQQLTWDLAAVKRIEEIGIGGEGGSEPHSHRTFPLGLRAFQEENKEEGKPPDPGAVVVKPTVKGGKLRYSEVSQQARRLPVVITLIVDQQHVDRVQTSFVNSKLRFMTTQVLMSRYPFSLNPHLNRKSEGGFYAPPKDGATAAATPAAAGFPLDTPGALGSARANEELEANVELVIYGIVTLYERFPPKRVAAPAPTSPAPTGVPPMP